jgi:AcrR family transcriptional regulator
VFNLTVMSLKENKNNTNKRKRGRPSDKSGIDRNAILKIALKEFSKHGYGGVSIKKISTLCEVNDSLLHYHFGNKEDLWKKAVSAAFDAYMKESVTTFKLLKHLSLKDTAKTLARQFIYYNSKFPELYLVIVHEMTQESPRSDWLIEHVLKPLTLKTSQLHGMLVKKGLSEDFPIPNLTTIFFSAANSIFLFNYQMKKQFGVDPFDEKEVEKHADIIVKIFYPNI